MPAEQRATACVEKLRDTFPDLGITRHLGGGSFKSQMKKADRSGAQLALLWGEDEVAAGEVTIKPLRGDGEQQRLPEEQLSERVQALLE